MENNTSKIPAIAYIRVSTDGQDKDDKFGKEAQRMAILDYADKNGYYITRWYEEVGSGASERPVIEEVIYGSDVKCPPVHALIVYKNDRVARDTKLYFTYLYFLERRGIKLLSVNEPEFEGEGAEFANVYRALLQFVAEQERKNIKGRTGAGRDRKAIKGGYAGGKPPYGYRIKDGQYEVVESEAEMVRRVFELYDKKEINVTRIVKMLNEEGFHTRSGSPFRISTIQNILNNRKTYEGYYRYGDNDWVKGVHTPLIKNFWDGEWYDKAILEDI